MALQLFKIADVLVESPVTSITFSSIPQGYTDLKLVASVRSNRASQEDGFGITLNSASSGYTYRVLSGNGTSASSVNTAYEQIWAVRVNGNSTTTNTFSSVDVYFPNYTGSTGKSYSADAVSENNATEAYTTLTALLQSSTSAITSLTVQTINSTTATGSTFTLYGIL
jgi:hypothetical protein